MNRKDKINTTYGIKALGHNFRLCLKIMLDKTIYRIIKDRK